MDLQVINFENILIADSRCDCTWSITNMILRRNDTRNSYMINLYISKGLGNNELMEEAGAFLTPSEARNIADQLILFAGFIEAIDGGSKQ